MKGFFKSIGRFFSKLFNTAPSWASKASSLIAVVTPLINSILLLTAGSGDAQACANIMSEVRRDLDELSTLVKDAKSGADVNAKINVLVQHLNSLLDAGHIKNADTRAKVEAIVKTVADEATAIASLFSHDLAQEERARAEL